MKQVIVGTSFGFNSSHNLCTHIYNGMFVCVYLMVACKHSILRSKSWTDFVHSMHSCNVKCKSPIASVAMNVIKGHQRLNMKSSK